MATSPTSNLRRSFGNLLDKLSSKPVSPDDTKSRKLSSSPCYVCSSRGKKNIICSDCSKVSCSSHSGTTSLGNLERTCDSCIRKRVMRDLSHGEVIKEKVSSQIQEILDERIEKTNNLNKLSTKVKNLTIELTASNEKVERETNRNMEKVENLKKENEKMMKEIEIWTQDYEKSRKNREKIENDFEMVSDECLEISKDNDELIKERTELLGQVKELTEFIRMQVPVKLLKKLVCNKCYFNVQNTFAASFKHVVPIKQENHMKPPPARKGACSSCSIF